MRPGAYVLEASFQEKASQQRRNAKIPSIRGSSESGLPCCAKGEGQPFFKGRAIRGTRFVKFRQAENSTRS